jgi:hypothetical protein
MTIPAERLVQLAVFAALSAIGDEDEPMPAGQARDFIERYADALELEGVDGPLLADQARAILSGARDEVER